MCAKFIVFTKRRELSFVVCLMLFLFGCTETIYLYPPDKSQCITVITKKWNAHRYIIAGKHHTVPENNFVKLDIDSGDRYRAGLYVCWKSGHYEWEVVVHKAEIVESTLDTTRFSFSTALPKDDRGFSTALKFTKEWCELYDFELKRIISDREGTIVEFK
ncbi:hypothetical protein EDS67_10810 [candidate division KSB1 bacterium]|nr:MAG: hypothetical protein EDS67_10810 [candidate division KSB1 bacterium]MBC6950745.1 hypothetical protein [candidate division KSB1 bacterium]MCE7945281.1 hypothetical protein [Chlorobi bacterium CHB1]MDL1875711.1 hypothetical protein [Cytophagia bacterium CHB2]